MRRLSYGLAMLLLLLSCRREDVSWTGQYLELDLSCSEALQTKAGEEEDLIYPQDGVDVRMHENLLTTVDLFFYPDNNTSADAVYHVFQDYGTAGKIRSDILRLPVDSDIINSVIFPSQQNITRCYIFAIVNYKGPERLVAQDANQKDILTGTSLPELMAKTVTTDFITPGGEKPEVESSDNMSHYHPNFMMSGSATMLLRGRNQILAGAASISLERYACKMTVGVKVTQQVVKDNEVWEPMLESMEIYLVDGVKNVTLAGTMPTETPQYISFRNNSMRFTDLSGVPLFEKDGDYLQTFPFYMYPQRWIYGNAESPNKEPYLKLVLPWKRVMGGYTQKQFYYKILIPEDYREENLSCFVRNNWYHLNIDVGILGAETDEAKVCPDVSFYVVDWQDKNVVIKNADIGKARYLSVDKDEYTIYNESQAKLSYVSSHPVQMQNVKVGRIYYGTKTSGNDLGGTIRTASAQDLFPEGTLYVEYSEAQRKNLNGGKDWFEDKESAIVITHTLNNNYEDPFFDYSYYKIQYTLVHMDRPDDAQYHKVQTLIQYPGIFLDRTPNPDTIHDNGNSSTTGHGGYVYINGGQYSQADYDKDGKNIENLWKVVCYNGGGTDMYKISATVLPPDSPFVIGDPRSQEITIPRNDYIEAKYVGGGDAVRSLSYYYPTDETSRTENMIAPSYRISTKLSGTYRSTKISHDGALQRCAAFQESGFPAGRWRLPTKAEISFSAQLSANGVFTTQFSDYYWSSNGVVNVKNGTVEPAPSATEAFVRCVYDSWYWGDDRVLDENGMPSIFIWGDAQR